MDAYEATRVVFSRIQVLDPENAAKIMGLLLIQDHGEKEMIRLAFGPETLLHSVILKARKELGLLSAQSPPSPTSPSPFHHVHLSRHNSSAASRFASFPHPPPPLNITSPSWAPPDHLPNPGPSDDLVSPAHNPSSSPSPYYNGGGDLQVQVDDLSIQDQLSFLSDPYQELGGGGWPHHHHPHARSPRSCSLADLCFGSEAAGPGFGWKPCLYFARGYCKNGTSCRFLHGLPDEAGAAGKPDPIGGVGMEQHCQEQLQLLRSKSQRLSAAAAGAFPYSPTAGSMAMPLSPSSSKCMSFLLQQQNDNQRVAAAAAMMLGDESHKFMGRSRLDRTDFANMVNPGSRQIYLTFPADSTFREEDVSNYFSIYGPVQDVRIPYQQKRMFGFVTFVYPETVKLILAKGNPHFVCDARVLVKPYKEKGKVPDKKQQQQGERGDFSSCGTPTGMDSRDPYDLQQLGARMLYGCGSPTQEMLLRRKLEEQQQQAAELQQAIEMQGRRFMGLQLMDFKSRSFSSSSPPQSITINPSNDKSHEESSPEDKSPSPASSGGEQLVNPVNVAAVSDKEESGREASPNEDSDFQESAEHNLPDSPFASPTKAKASAFAGGFSAPASATTDPDLVAASAHGTGNRHLLPQPSSLDTPSFKSCLFQMPWFSSGHGAVGL
ncbi:zinc finger CCCH domain-containing protein 53-like [Iris pallida]|uniref:Zinc finger CCCH domain-containing protein 53-like n=1 Tax=Iris pallida TaxID=29817 RepID=A0AAX6HMT5_IRIPA|nr:zinc finger CCCH domain-containing protein 53-like [Iris pallida]